MRTNDDPTGAIRLKTRVVADGECRRWIGSRNHKGYGYITVQGKQWSAHRLAYELSNGPIPEGLEIDHLCGVRDCVNPNHLEAVTHHVNIQRKTYPPTCSQGHKYPENLYRPSDRTGRRCRICLWAKAKCDLCGELRSVRNMAKHRRFCSTQLAVGVTGEATK